MADETTTTAEAPAEQAKGAKKSSKLPLILGLVVVLVGGGGGAAWFLMHKAKPAEAAAAVREVVAPKITQHLDGFTVNLADGEDNHFLRVTIDLGLAKAPEGGGEKGDNFPTSRVRDAMLPVLTAGKADVLMTTDGKEQLKKDLLAALKDKVPELDVQEIYFTEFLVQR